MACTALSAPLTAMGQQVYRCETHGKVSYSHEPCLGAKAIDTTPTQGMDKMTGRSKKGADVQKAEHDRSFAEALKPLTGKTPEEFEAAKRRIHHSPLEKLSCSQFDGALPRLAQDAAHAAPEDRNSAEARLYKARKAFRDLRC